MAIPKNYAKFRRFSTDYNFLLFFPDNDFLSYYTFYKLDNFFNNEKFFSFYFYFSFFDLIEQKFYTTDNNAYLFINTIDSIKFFNDFLDMETVIHA
jgi:hypothetical protein